MAQGALWGVGLWDQDKWDTIALFSPVTEGPDTWASSVRIINTYTGQINELPDVWASSVRVIDKLSGSVTESIDLWAATIEVHPPGTSVVQEKPDIWSADVRVTLYPYIYGAGGGWGWTWYSDVPRWDSKDDLERAYDKWRYTVDASVSGKSDTWGGKLETFELDPALIRRQVETMFGSTTFVDWDEEAIIEELLS